MINKWRSGTDQGETPQYPDAGQSDLQGVAYLPRVHSHSAADRAAVATSRRVNRAVVALLLGVAVATLLGLIALWPNPVLIDEMVDRADPISGGTTTVHGEVLSVQDPCDSVATGAGAPITSGDPGTNAAPDVRCVQISVGILSGTDAGRLVKVQVTGPLASAGIRSGDEIELVATGQVAPEEGPSSYSPAGPAMNYALSGVDRTVPLVLLSVLFAGVVIAVGRLRGFLALVALGVSGAVLGLFVLPALVAGGPGLLIGMVGSTAIMFVTLFFVHGPNMRTAAALIGTLFGILFVSAISVIAVSSTRLSGVGDEASGVLSGLATEMDLRGLLTCSILIAGLGVLNDITIAQASSVWELRSAAPQMSRRELYLRAMRIGRDHIASTVYTVVFAYVGAALGVLILLYLIDVPMMTLLSREDIVIEIVRTLCGSVGLVLAVPVTTAVAAWFVSPEEPPEASASMGPRAGLHFLCLRFLA